MKENKYKYSKAYFKIKDVYLGNDIIIIQGGQGSSKTISILQLLIKDSLANSELEVSIVSEELTKMKRTVVKDFIKVLKDWNLYSDNNFNKSTLTYTFNNNSFIEFISLDKTDVGKGLRRDVSYFNEANKIEHESYVQVASRSKKVVMDFNPDRRFYAHDLMNDNNCVILTYKDNQYLAQQEVNSILDYKEKGYHNKNIENYHYKENIKSSYWANKWQVYGLGVTGSLDGLVFNYTEIDQVPQEAELKGYGMDFGYSVDPTTLIAVYEYNNTYIADELLYQTGLTNYDISKELDKLEISKKEIIIADSSEPKSIKEINMFGYRVIGAVKGSDSILNGIQKILTKDLLVTRRSHNLKHELENYTWYTDKNGVQINKPKGTDHAIDAMRYIISYDIQKPIKNIQFGF